VDPATGGADLRGFDELATSTDSAATDGPVTDDVPFDAGTVAVVVIDPSGEIRSANQAAGRLHRAHGGATNLWRWVSPADARRLHGLARRVGGVPGASGTTSVGLIGPNGDTRHHDVVLTSFAGSPSSDGFVAVILDATVNRHRAVGPGDVEAHLRASAAGPPGAADRFADIRRGLDADEFDVHYQPIVHLADGGLLGAEALVRWHHPIRGLVRPDEFVPDAEAGGLIHDLGRRILDKAFRQHRVWRTTTGVTLPLHVNLSARQLHHPDLAEDIAAAARLHGVAPRTVVLELTESALIRDHRAAEAMVDRLRHEGFRIAIDDIGTGHSSLARLKRFRIDILKIDRSFVTDLGHDPRDAAIVGSIVFLAEALGLEVVVEGVETDEQRAILLRLGCRHAQGYLFAPALAPADFRRLLPAGDGRSEAVAKRRKKAPRAVARP
jgi:EAL domain-containing protein (putative c-di-GMP-specific phosphodiesterase class I)